MTRPIRHHRAALLLSLAFLPALAAAQQPAAPQQEVRGSVTEGSTLAPIEGAMVLLLDRGGRRITGVLSGANGRFRVPVPTPGRYFLRVDRIGYGSTDSPMFEVAGGASVQQSVESAVRPVQLAGIDVTASSRRCEVRPSEGLATARVWEEARKALAAATWTSDRAIYNFTWMKFERVMDEYAQAILSEKRTFSRQYSTNPFGAIDPDTLKAKGYIEVLSNGDLQYWAPDATVLLSDAFLDTHCFKLQRGERDGNVLIGLVFEPLGTRRLTDVEGVLWLDQATARLLSIEYHYTNLREGPADHEAGGNLTLIDLPNGTWIVKEWSIRMPVITELRNARTARSTYQVTGYRVEGAVVQRAVTNTGEVVMDEISTGARGTVVDSLGLPAKGVRVFVWGTESETFTDSLGAFSLPNLGKGKWRVGVSIPMLEFAGVDAGAVEVEVGQSGMTAVTLEIPPLNVTFRALCTDEPMEAGEVVVLGRVLGLDGNPVPGAEVHLVWRSVQGISDQGIRRGVTESSALTDDRGAYRICGVPAEPVRIWAILGGRRSPDQTVLPVAGAQSALATVVLPDTPAR